MIVGTNSSIFFSLKKKKKEYPVREKLVCGTKISLANRTIS